MLCVVPWSASSIHAAGLPRYESLGHHSLSCALGRAGACGGCFRCALAGRVGRTPSLALVVMLARFEFLVTCRAYRQLHTMPTFFARPSLVGRSAVMLQQLRTNKKVLVVRASNNLSNASIYTVHWKDVVACCVADSIARRTHHFQAPQAGELALATCSQSQSASDAITR